MPVRGGVVVNESRLTVSLAEKGLGLAYTLEPLVLEPLRAGRLRLVLERYAPTVPGFFLYFPSVARRSAPLRLFVEATKELAVRAATGLNHLRTADRTTRCRSPGPIYSTRHGEKPRVRRSTSVAHAAERSG